MENDSPTAYKNQYQKVLIVVNPVSGIKDPTETIDTIREFCLASGWDYDIHETKPDEDLTALVREFVKEKCDCVLAAGGDGTVASVVRGLVNCEVPLGILPLGTGNVMARNLGIPLGLENALKLIISEDQTIQTMDVIRVGESYYVVNVSIGVSAEVMEKTRREEKRRFGFLAYLHRGIDTISRANLHRFYVDVDGRKVSFLASEVMIANGKLMGLQPLIDGVDVKTDDGELNMFIVRVKTLLDTLGVILRFIVSASRNGDMQLKHLAIRDFVHIRTNRVLSVQADGEVIGKTPVEIHVVPQALRVIIPTSR